jgi:hypothetical protein
MAPWLAALALAACPSTTVHYGATSVGTPWVASGAITGHLFAYTHRTLMDGRVNGSDGFVLYTHGRTPEGATKILWRVGTPRRSARTMTIRATQLDGPGAFTQRLPGTGGTSQFPSIVDLPAAGCWRLSLQSGRVRAAFVLRAVDAPAESFCEPTVVLREIPHPRFGDVTWMPTAPRRNGIAAVLFVSTLPGADRALIYAGGRAPEGWSTKFLWWSPKPGGSLTLDGRRLDGVGTFRQSFQGATGVSPPVTGPVFPSIVEIPTAGCWAVRVSTGGRAGLAVFNAVVTS